MQVNPLRVRKVLKASRHDRGWRVMQNDLSYFVRRVAQERAAASSAADDRVREAHERMADHYQALILSAGKAEAAA